MIESNALLHVFKFLHGQDFQNNRLVCKYWNTLCKDLFLIEKIVSVIFNETPDTIDPIPSLQLSIEGQKFKEERDILFIWKTYYHPYPFVFPEALSSQDILNAFAKAVCAFNTNAMGPKPRNRLHFTQTGLTYLPPPLFFTKNVVELNLSHNPIQNLPQEIAKFQELHVLDLSHTHLEELPDGIGHLFSLVRLSIHHANLQKLPQALGELKKLEILNISHNRLQESSIPKGTIAKLEKLKELYLQGVEYREYLHAVAEETYLFLPNENRWILNPSSNPIDSLSEQLQFEIMNLPNLVKVAIHSVNPHTLSPQMQRFPPYRATVATLVKRLYNWNPPQSNI